MSQLALTMGDPAGIGPDITVKSWVSHQRTKGSSPLPSFFCIADPTVLAARADALGLAIPIQIIEDPSKVSEIFDQALPVLATPLSDPVQPGVTSPAHAQTTVASIAKAAELVAQGSASGIVTNPIAKATLYAKSFKHPGHTEFLGELATRHWRTPSPNPIMMLADGDRLRVVPATVHIPLADVAKTLTTERLISVISTTHLALQRDFGIKKPRLAVTGLNPHAGEGGALGDEEIQTIIPALEAVRSQGIDATGPHPADTLFHAAARKHYDAAIAMYHDQALLPLKTLAFDHGVNITLGLPFVRTSPDHGTAFDIAGTGAANPASLIAALNMAARMIALRRQV
ncbi:MAG: 4-hydroxythreonine-4-phosphate dehydrogenase PdxA [Hyphomicrobiaceae bacterium]